MGKAQLRCHPGDAAGRACLITAHEVNRPINLVEVDDAEASASYPNPMSLPPTHLPAFDDNGFHLWESRAVMEYLAGHSESIFPRKDVVLRAKIQDLLFFDASALAPAITSYVYPMVFQKLAPMAGTSEAKALIAAPLQKLEGVLQGTGGPYVTGTFYCIADIALFATVSLLELTSWDIASDANYPHIGKWYATVAEREHVKEGNKFFDEWKASMQQQVQSVIEADAGAELLWSRALEFMKRCFDLADRDGSGELDRQELRAAVHKVFQTLMAEIFVTLEIPMPSGMRLDPAEMESLVDEIIAECDANSDEKVSFKELLREVTSRGFTKDAMTRALVDMPETVERLSKMLQDLHDKHVIS